MGLAVTVLVYLAARALQARVRLSVLNPVLVSMLVLVIALIALKIPYSSYTASADWLTRLLEPSVVALAVPLFRQLPTLRRQVPRLLGVGIGASLLAMATSIGAALLFRASRTVALSTLPKSVTTPIAIAISSQIGGTPSLTVVSVVVAGVVGAAFGPMLLTSTRVSSPAARGLAMGASAHALGTARIGEEGEAAQAHSSVALVACGVFTALLAPAAAWIVMTLWP